jgi:hypothetical protein
MKQFDVLDFNPDQCRTELAELRDLLAASTDLKETQDILPFFRARRHLSAFLPRPAAPVRVHWLV